MNYTLDQVRALLDLYKIAPASANHAAERQSGYNVFTPADQLEYGILFVDKHLMGVSVTSAVMELANELYGINPEAINSTFYKNRDTVLGKDRFTLFVDQVIHYLGTYGRDAMGEKPITLIPMQELSVPDVDLSKIRVTVIRLVGDNEVVESINKTMTTTKTPSNRIVSGMRSLIPFFSAPIGDIRSFELAILAYDYFHVVPVDARMFLRYLIFKTTGETLIVNNQRTVKAIKNAAAKCGTTTARLFGKANMVNLSSIFLRDKNLFLAFKTHEGCAPIINRLRRLADTYHKPMSDVSVQNYINLATHGRIKDARTLIPNMDNREIVKLLNAILFRVNMIESTDGVFNVRNGRSYCKEGAFEPLTEEELAVLNNELDWLLNCLERRLRPSIQGKHFYIPEYVNYPVPVTEKQFVGNLPWGTFFYTDCDDFHPDMPATIGVQWVNPDDDDWVDLDLHCFSADGHHFGWNSEFYGDKGQVTYSGDMTNAPAPDGAAEAFWVKNVDTPLIFTLNEYRGPSDMKFRLALSREFVNDHGNKNFVMDPNQLLFAPIPLQFHDATSMTLGYFHNGTFYLYSGNLSEGAVPKGNFYKYINGIIYQNENKTLLANLLDYCGGSVIRTSMEREELEANGETVIDLSPEAITSSTLLDIVDGLTA